MNLTKNEFNDILHTYELKRQKAKDDLELKKEKLFSKIPELKEIDEKLNTLSFSYAKQILLDSDNATKLLEEISSLKKQKENILSKNNITSKDMTMEYECLKCNDTGFIEGQKCTCLIKKVLEFNYEKSGLSETLKTENFDKFNFSFYKDNALKNIQTIYSASLDFCNNFDNEFTNMYFYGSVGLGKTFLCNSIAKELLDKGKIVMYLTSFEMFKTLSDITFGKTEDESNYMQEILNCDLLIIDDLGSEFSTSLSKSELFNILNYRLMNKKSTIISTNLSLTELEKQYSSRIASRIIGNFDSFKFIGDDIRIQKKYN